MAARRGGRGACEVSGPGGGAAEQARPGVGGKGAARLRGAQRCRPAAGRLPAAVGAPRPGPASFLGPFPRGTWWGRLRLRPTPAPRGPPGAGRGRPLPPSRLRPGPGRGLPWRRCWAKAELAAPPAQGLGRLAGEARVLQAAVCFWK